MKVQMNRENDEYSQILRLEKPAGRVDVVLDTDTYNEIDDQYALSYLLRSDEKLDTRAIYAAPFSNRKAVTPAEGMEKSYREILNILSLNGREDLSPTARLGSEQYLADEKTPVHSPAAEDLAERAMNYSPEKPLYVVAIGAITNIASAILLNPEIIHRIVIVWLGGNAYFWPDNREFNLFQDVAAARIVFGCGVPLMPAFGIVDYCRVGPDVTLDWDDKPLMRLAHRERPSTRHAVGNAIYHRQLDGRAFLSDTDAFFLRKDNIRLSESQKVQLYEACAEYGSMLLSGDDVSQYDDPQIGQYRSIREAWAN